MNFQVDADGFQPRTIPIKINELKADEWPQFINVTLYRNESKEIETNQALWSNASQLDDGGREPDSSSEQSTIKLETEPQTSSSSETSANAEDLFVKQQRGYLVEESKSSSDLTQDCTFYTVALFLLTVLCLK